MTDTAKRILLVENCQRGMSATFSQFIREAGGRVKLNTSSNIRDAGHRLDDGRFDLVLLSLHLRDGEGIDVLKSMKMLARETPVAVLLNHDEHHLEHEVISLGAVGTFRNGEVDINGAINVCAAFSDAGVDTSGPFNKAAAAEPEAVKGIDPAELELDVEEDDSENELDAADIEELSAEVICEVTQEDEIVQEPVTQDAGFSATIGDEVDNFKVESVAAQEAAEAASDEEPAEGDSQSVVAEPGICDMAGQQQDAEVASEDISPEEVEKVDDNCLSAEEVREIADQTAAVDSGVFIGDSLLEKSCEAESAMQDLEGVIRVLEERCRELEAGQTALIEAEHVAIEREKKAREKAEARVSELEKKLSSESDLKSVEEERSKLEKLLEDALKREKELVSAAEVEAVRKKLFASEKELAGALNNNKEMLSLLEAAKVEADKSAALNEQVRSLQAQLENNAAQLKELENNLMQERKKVEAARAESGKSAELNEQIKSLQGQLTLRVSQIEKLDNDLELERGKVEAALQKSEEHAATLRAEVDGLKEEVKDTLWKLASAEEERDGYAIRCQELEQAAVEVARESDEIELLKKELENAAARKAALEEQIGDLHSEKAGMASRIEDLQMLVNRLHALADRSDEFDVLADTISQLSLELKTEQAARRRLGTELRKAQSREAKMEILEKSLVDLEWEVHDQQEALAGAQAKVEELELGCGDAELIRENNELKLKIDELESANKDFIQKQMARVDELTELYERSQMERLELSNKLSELDSRA